MFKSEFLKIVAFLVIILSVSLGAFFSYKKINNRSNLLSPLSDKKVEKQKPLNRYTFANLKNTNFPKSDITLGDILYQDKTITSRLFFFSDNEKRISGLINLPEQKPQAILILLRGYVDRDIYQTGDGTYRIGQALARAGFITLAPDFLGYGQSASPSAQPLEERFQTYTTTLSLLASLKNLPTALNKENLNYQFVLDPEKIGLFGHSNGGHIALATLELTGDVLPTVLWAPVSKPFPYSILYYTDEFEDNGKALRKLVADFEKDYDADQFSITSFFDWINAPIQIHQGKADIEVPVWWSDELVKTLQQKDKEVTYFTYPGGNHNFDTGNWNQAINRSIKFYQDFFNKQ